MYTCSFVFMYVEAKIRLLGNPANSLLFWVWVSGRAPRHLGTQAPSRCNFSSLERPIHLSNRCVVGSSLLRKHHTSSCLCMVPPAAVSRYHLVVWGVLCTKPLVGSQKTRKPMSLPHFIADKLIYSYVMNTHKKNSARTQLLKIGICQ